MVGCGQTLGPFAGATGTDKLGFLGVLASPVVVGPEKVGFEGGEAGDGALEKFLAALSCDKGLTSKQGLVAKSTVPFLASGRFRVAEAVRGSRLPSGSARESHN